MSTSNTQDTQQEKHTITLPNDEFVKFIERDIQEGHSVTIVAKGWSMRPFLENRRDKIILTPLPTSGLKVGDVVLAKTDINSCVLHRIIKIEGSTITLQGDGNAFGTERTSNERVVAKATAFIRKGRQKAESIDSAKWRIYSFIWMHTRPLRRYLLYIYRHFLADNEKYGKL